MVDSSSCLRKEAQLSFRDKGESWIGVSLVHFFFFLWRSVCVENALGNGRVKNA